MEIKPNELRIGNLVWSVEAKEPTNIFLMGMHRLLEEERDNKPRSYKPIALTPEWLEKFGFKKSQHIFKTAFWNIDVAGHQLMINPENGAVAISFDSNQIINPAKIQYVHQLQNLYFALTGKELAIDNKSI